MDDNAELIEKLRRWVACPDPFDTAHAAADALEAADAENKRLSLELEAEKRQVETLEQLLDELGKQIDEALARENGK